MGIENALFQMGYVPQGQPGKTIINNGDPGYQQTDHLSNLARAIDNHKFEKEQEQQKNMDLQMKKMSMYKTLRDSGYTSDSATNIVNGSDFSKYNPGPSKADEKLNADLEKIKSETELNKKKTSAIGGNPGDTISKLAEYNQNLQKAGLGGYQGIQTANGNIIARAKASGIMNQLNNDQMDSLSNGLLNNQMAPSQLPRDHKNQIIAAAMQKDPTYNAAQVDMDFAANKMGAASFEKNFNNLDSFHRDFEKNADYLLQLSANYDRSTIPLVNKAIISGATGITGNPKATQLLQAINTVANGYARLQNPTLTGQALSDASRKEAQDLANSFMSNAQLKSLLDPQNGSMRVDANNRVIAANEVRSRIQSTYKKQTPNKSYEYYLQSIGK